MKKHTVFLPMPLAGFEQSFRANVPYLNLKTPFRYFADENYIGRLKNGRFTLSYLQIYNHGLFTVLTGEAVKCEGGIFITYRFRKSVYSMIVFSLISAITLLMEGVGLYAVIQSQASASLLLLPIPFFAVFLLLMLVKAPRAEKRLYEKPDCICCGLLEASREKEK